MGPFRRVQPLSYPILSLTLLLPLAEALRLPEHGGVHDSSSEACTP